jgi:hypothetical protein
MSTSTTCSTSITRQELYELVWAEPMTKVAPRFGLSDVGLGKLCKRYDVPRPPVGYWAQKQYGKAPACTPLPPIEDESLQTITFRPEEKQAAAPSASDRVSDEQLKELISFGARSRSFTARWMTCSWVFQAIRAQRERDGEFG